MQQGDRAGFRFLLGLQPLALREEPAIGDVIAGRRRLQFAYLTVGDPVDEVHVGRGDAAADAGVLPHHGEFLAVRVVRHIGDPHLPPVGG
jgi:hypothetical protein